jgi:hypothetical protein
LILCKQCGNSNEDGAEFCGSCGSFLEWTGEKVATAPPPPPPPPPEEPERPGIVQRVKAAVGMEAPGTELDSPPAAPEQAAGAAEAAQKRDAQARAAAAEAQRQADEARRAEEQARQRAEEARRAEAEARRRADAEAQRQAQVERAAREAAERAAAEAARAEAERVAKTQAEAEAARAEAERVAKTQAEAETARAAAERTSRARAEAEAAAVREAPALASAEPALASAEPALASAEPAPSPGQESAPRDGTEEATPSGRTRARAASSFGGTASPTPSAAPDLSVDQAAARSAAEEAATATPEEEGRLAAEQAAAKAKAEEEQRHAAEQAAARARAEEEAARAEEQAAARAAAEVEAARAAEVARKAEEAARRAAALVAKPPPAPPVSPGTPAGQVVTAARGSPSPPAPAPVASSIPPAASGQVPAPATAGQPPAQHPGAEQPAAVKPGAARPRPVPAGPTAPSRSIEPGDLICGQCGEGNAPTRKFCRRCGNSLITAAVAPRPPWWKRLFRRKKKVLVAGERPGGRGSGGRSIAQAPSVAGKIVKLLLALLVLAGAVAVIGPYHQRATNDIQSLRRRFLPHYTATYATGASASTSQPNHPPSNLIDGHPNTYWASGPTKDGVGTILTVTFPKPVDLGKLGFTLGDSDDFLAQPRPAKIRVEYAGGGSDIPLQNTAKFQSVNFTANKVTTLNITILDVYPASIGHFCSIAEIEFFART